MPSHFFVATEACPWQSERSLTWIKNHRFSFPLIEAHSSNHNENNHNYVGADVSVRTIFFSKKWCNTYANFYTSWKCRKPSMKISPPMKAAPKSHSVQGSFLNLSLFFVFSRMSMSWISVCSYFLRRSSSSSEGDLLLPTRCWCRFFKPTATAPIRIIFNKL